MPEAVQLNVRVIPNAPADRIVGWLDDALKVKVRAPAIDGKANDALIQFLSRTLGLPRRDIELVAGEKARRKIIRISGLDQPELNRRITAASA